MEYGVNKTIVKIAIRFHILVFPDVVRIKLTQSKNVLENVSQIRAQNKRTSNVNDVALLAPDAPNLYLERQDDAANSLKF